MFKRRRLLVLIAVACLIFASMPLMNVSALSNGKKVYYITDSFDYFNVQSAIGSGSVATVDQCLYIPYNGSGSGIVAYNSFENNFEKGIRDNWAGGWFYLIEPESYVIFEMMNGLSELPQNENLTVPVFTELLEDIFEYLNESLNCKIAFLCDTDEAKFAWHETFLNYVDIHVNTDLRTPFAHSVMNRIRPMIANNDANSEGSIKINILFDSVYVDSYSNGSCKYAKDIMAEIMHALKTICNISREDIDDVAAACKDKNTHLYSVSPDETYKNLETNMTADFADIMLADMMIYIMYPDYSYNADCDMIEFCLNTYGPENFYAFSYGETWIQVSDELNFSINSVVFLMQERFEYRLDVISTFLLDGDLYVFNNWRGLCEITYKTIEFSDDGWVDGANAYRMYVKPLYD